MGIPVNGCVGVLNAYWVIAARVLAELIEIKPD